MTGTQVRYIETFDVFAQKVLSLAVRLCLDRSGPTIRCLCRISLEESFGDVPVYLLVLDEYDMNLQVYLEVCLPDTERWHEVPREPHLWEYLSCLGVLVVARGIPQLINQFS